VSALRLATRKSALALAQSGQVAQRIRDLNPGVEVELVHIVTEGDRVQDRPLAAIGGKGLFVKEIEIALLDGRADLAVHSMKDLPSEVAVGLAIAAVPLRESPWDLLVTADGRGLDGLAQGARVGTSSQRRAVQLLAARPDLVVSMLRGNVDTRLRRLAEGVFDAIVLAEAGVLRLGLTVAAVRLEGVLVPAVAQGALALEARIGDARTHAPLRLLHDEVTSVETAAERAVMRALSGSCVTPMGALARWDRVGGLSMTGFLATDDGAKHARATIAREGVRDAAEAEAVGTALAARLRASLAEG
jgi:hydroxymethylbilane synthase